MATAKLPLLLLTLSLLASASAPAEDAVAGETPLAKEAHSQLRAELEQLRSKIYALGPTRVPFMRSPPPKQLEKKNEEQRRIIKKTEQALIVAEEELMRTQLEETSKSTESIKVHGAWLPPWLANFMCHFQDLAVIHWNEHGKPAVNLFLEKASEKSAQVQELAKPHLETVKTKWIPVAKDQLVTFTTHVGPYVDTVSTKTVEFYTICRSSITPHVIKVQEFAYPHLQKVSESAKPHIDKISSFTKPHVEKVRAVLKPYTEHLAHAYGEFLKSATLFRQQVHGAWLPPWLASFICHFQDLAVIHWNEHGKPAMNVFLEKHQRNQHRFMNWPNPTSRP